MPPNRKTIVDLTQDLEAAARLGASVELVDRLLGESIDALGELVPFDLATVMELRDDSLRVRVARGTLAGPKVEQHQLSLDRFPSVRDLLETGSTRAFTEHDHSDGDGDPFDGVLDLPHGHSCMVVPLRVRGEPLGIMTFDRQVCGQYSDSVVQLADVFGKLLGVAMSYGAQSSLLARMRDQLGEHSRLLSEKLTGEVEAGRLLAASRSPAMSQVVRVARQVAPTDTPVLISGETGTGKEVLANAIHGWSRRSGRPLVSLNCAVLPEGLVESELFGHVKGAFSGATTNRMGRFQVANGGTLFLDEIGELPPPLQAKLLRALQEGCFEPVGSDRTIRVDVRIIAATNLDLGKAVEERRFREDLYYRLAVFPVHLPPLRERPEDVEVIAEGFLERLSQRTGHGPWQLTPASLRWLESQPWKGNVRELVNALERATIISDGTTLTIGDDTDGPARFHDSSRPPASTARGDLITLEEMEREHILRALTATDGKLYGPGGSADLLGVNPNTLRSRMKKLGLGGARDYRSRKP
jgi:transcriptional regulator with GAF, ATPase, and Fis domain